MIGKSHVFVNGLNYNFHSFYAFLSLCHLTSFCGSSNVRNSEFLSKLHSCLQVLFFEQVRPTVNGSLPDDNSGSIHDPKYGEEINLPKVNNDNSRKSSSEQALGKAP